MGPDDFFNGLLGPPDGAGSSGCHGAERRGRFRLGQMTSLLINGWTADDHRNESIRHRACSSTRSATNEERLLTLRAAQ